MENFCAYHIESFLKFSKHPLLFFLPLSKVELLPKNKIMRFFWDTLYISILTKKYKWQPKHYEIIQSLRTILLTKHCAFNFICCSKAGAYWSIKYDSNFIISFFYCSQIQWLVYFDIQQESIYLIFLYFSCSGKQVQKDCVSLQGKYFFESWCFQS